MLGVLYLVFSSFLGSSIQYFPLYLLLGLIMWNMFTRSTSIGLGSLLARSGLVTKVYFPREVLPIAACVTSAIMMTFEFGAFAIFMVVFQFIPPVTILYLPLLIVLLFIVSQGMAFLLSIANVYFRDMQYIWGVVLQAGFFLLPIFFTLDIYAEDIQHILYLNPMAILLKNAHDVTLYNISPDPGQLGYPAAFAAGILVLGFVVFKHFESKVIEIL